MQKERLYGLDILRIVSAFMVLLFHSHIGSDIWCDYSIFNPFISMGAIFMTAFFMLSGFLLFYGNHQNNLQDVNNVWRFLKKRFLAIMPLYYVFTLLYVVFLGKESFLDNIFLAPIEIAGLQSVFCTIWDKSHNGGTWFISCLLLCYLVYPFIQEMIKQIKSRKKLLIFILCAGILLYSPFIVWRFSTFMIYNNPFFRILEFIEGIILADYFCSRRDTINRIMFSWPVALGELMLLFCIVSIAVKIGISPGNYMLYNWIALPLFSIMLISWGGVQSNRFVCSNLVDFLSKISYSLFLAQFFLWDVMRFLFKRYGVPSNLEKIALSVVGGVLFASVMYLLIEKPITSQLKNKILR